MNFKKIPKIYNYYKFIDLYTNRHNSIEDYQEYIIYTRFYKYF